MPPEEPWTIGRLLAWTAEFFKKKGSDSPRLDAEVMLAHVLGYERVQLYTHYEDVVGERARGEYRDLVRRRSEGTPVAYLVGRKEFYSLRFDVTPAVLIPRPETEFVVMEFLAAVKEIEGPTAIDVGTGSGCIAVACAKHKPGARFAAIDASADALDVARRNAARHAVADRIEFLEGDLLAPLAGRPAVDVIVSNPPYIATAEVEALDPGVRDFEPRLALDGGVDGLDAYRRIAAQAPPLLKSGGRLILEIGFSQDAEVAAIIESTPGLRFSATVRDLQGHPRVVLATRE
ncbi:MAG: protein-(glutamine-N5) methyltransferase, release factor-specific [Planctomycetales bacterium 71-10]|nr:MAG: protein-(glutamine-N5) methyltransferase, release factor-specific [Planctomycetales bacterium 71-10]